MLSISIGIAGFPDSGSNYQKLFENADAALYVAKNSGKAMSRVFEA
jgi:predicted signal transduction protein with EAL and GGDEF domain